VPTSTRRAREIEALRKQAYTQQFITTTPMHTCKLLTFGFRCIHLQV